MLDALSAKTGGGVVGLVRTPTQSWLGASGLAPEGRPAEAGDAFDIASTGKTLTAIVVLQLAAEGRLSLDDTVDARLPGRVRDGQRITIRQLLNHTSGLPAAMTMALLPIDEQPSLTSEPGTKHEYSNTNFAIAELIAEAVSGQAMPDMVRDRILKPLGLEASGLKSSPGASPIRSWLGGTGGSDGMTATELATVFQALAQGVLLKDAERDAMLTPFALVDPSAIPSADVSEATSVGLGIFGFDLACGRAWGHGGQLPTYSNQVLVSPDGAKVVVVAQNAGDWTAAKATAIDLFCA